MRRVARAGAGALPRASQRRPAHTPSQPFPIEGKGFEGIASTEVNVDPASGGGGPRRLQGGPRGYSLTA